MRLIDFYPSHGSFSPGDTVTFLIELDASSSEHISLQIFIRHLGQECAVMVEKLDVAPGKQMVQMNWVPPTEPAGYSAELEIHTGNSPVTLQAATAFDVLASWIDFPRYGFLTDFRPSRQDPETVLQKLTRFHINGLQFYDWQYRHDQLLAPTEEYIDPLGREMSLASVRALVKAAHRHGMAAMPYMAVYAASADFWRAHADWALYEEMGKPIAFGENFLGLMDPSSGGSWSKHLLAEGARALQGIPFDGLHIDQYGDPKQAWNAQGDRVDLPRAFVDFIQAVSDQHPQKTVLFNAVGNWPSEALAASDADFMYIEVWPPDVEYRQLAEIILNAVQLSEGKAVVIALYLPANRPANNLLADAVIIACGGTRIELGEDTRLLSDPYFPRHEKIPSDLYSELRRLSDFIVRNGEWLRPYTLTPGEKKMWSEGLLNPESISADVSLMIVKRRSSMKTVLQLVNFSDFGSHLRWDEAHVAPQPRRNVSVAIQISQSPAQVLWDCPERKGGLQMLDFEYSGGTLTFHIPQINYIGLVVIHD